jgi:hypothetical protein
MNLTVTQKEKLKRALLIYPVALSLHPDIEQDVIFNFKPVSLVQKKYRFDLRLSS